MKRYIVALTGASGSIYAVRLLEELLKTEQEVHFIASDNGKKVLEYELETTFDSVLDPLYRLGGVLKLHENDNLFASVASGSFKTSGMAVIPCSMSTLGEIATGTSKSLMGRAADVCLKEKRKLVLVPRETPFSPIHLKNMLYLSEIGVTILPAMPAFYNKPKTLDDVVNFVVGRTLDALGVGNTLYREWGEEIVDS